MPGSDVVFPTPLKHSLDELMDAFAWMLSTSPQTNDIQWILGDVGMGSPTQLPFAYISRLNQAVKWSTANGSSGGLAAGLDDWSLPIVITLVLTEHEFISPVTATPPAGNVFANEPQPLPYFEQPGWRDVETDVNSVLSVLRENITVGGFAATTTVNECKPILLTIDQNLYRCERISIQAQQRRTRGV